MQNHIGSWSKRKKKLVTPILRLLSLWYSIMNLFLPLFIFLNTALNMLFILLLSFWLPLTFGPALQEWMSGWIVASRDRALLPLERTLPSIPKRFLSTPAFNINCFSRTELWSLFIWQINMSTCHGLPFCVKIRQDTLPHSLQGWPPEVLVSELRNLENSAVSWKISSYVPPQGTRAYGRYKLNPVVTWIANYSLRQICGSSMLITLGYVLKPFAINLMKYI